jgi:1,4-alpha-glucan branching enzyme
VAAVPAPREGTATVVLATPDAAETVTVPVRFVYHAPGARQVAIAGTFNDWNPEALPMIRGHDGVFYAIVELPRGRHEYMLVVDGEWLVDPAAPMSIDDGFGRRNGVLEV